MTAVHSGFLQQPQHWQLKKQEHDKHNVFIIFCHQLKTGRALKYSEYILWSPMRFKRYDVSFPILMPVYALIYLN